MPFPLSALPQRWLVHCSTQQNLRPQALGLCVCRADLSYHTDPHEECSSHLSIPGGANIHIRVHLGGQHTHQGTPGGQHTHQGTPGGPTYTSGYTWGANIHIRVGGLTYTSGYTWGGGQHTHQGTPGGHIRIANSCVIRQ